jgi:predicted ribosome quality control (RQC) complex YloA/Tae2 family protein
VGRSNQENDYVTHRLAKPDDYWFHVHGCPGSHVILRREGRKDNPSARTIEEVAAIAAFFSKARTSRKAPVIYTLKKYVRKARGGSPGLAIVTRERTIMVVPEASVDAGPPGWGDEDQET